MINFIYGSFGTGKTTEVLNRIKNDIEKGIPCFLIIPDQEAVQFEHLTLNALPVSAQLKLEVLSFSRLYNRVCRKYGGLSYFYLTKPMRSLIMWKSLRNLAKIGALKEYHARALEDPSLTDLMISTINEFKANGITPTYIDKKLSSLPKDSSLRNRMEDISLIYAYFNNFVSEKYTDSADDLMKLKDLISKHNFFEGCNVYIDSFYSFTGVQHMIIKEIFESANDVTVTIPLSSDKIVGISDKGVKRSHDKLIDNLPSNSTLQKTFLTENQRTKSPCIKFLSQNLWEFDVKRSAPMKVDDSIIYEECYNRYAEAEAVTAHILELLRSGARCKDIVVIARDVEKYKGIIDTALKKSNIPCFLDQKSDLCSTPIVKLLLSALRIKKYNWQRQDVLSYLKTGMCGVDERDVHLFEEYVNTWNINGQLFQMDTWTMNPDGIVDRPSERGETVLKAANRVRSKLVTSLTEFFLKLDSSSTFKEMCIATYEFMQTLNVEESLKKLSDKISKLNDPKQSDELSRTYEIILNTLADIAEVLSDEDANSDDFMQILRNTFENTEIGSIPTSIDEVTVGSASILRTSSPKYAFVIGLCEGEFPAPVKDDGLLNKNDRSILEQNDFELSDNSDIRSADELMYIQRAFSAPSEKLFILTHKAEISGKECFPSLAFTRVSKLFIKNDASEVKTKSKEEFKPHKYKISDFNYVVPSPKNAASIYKALEEGAEKEALREALEKYMPGFTSTSSKPVSTSSYNVSEEAVDLAFKGDTLFSSSSSFEKYVECPFKYYCSNVLKLRENPTSQFRANNVGSFVHYILEKLITHAIPTDPDVPPADDDELIRLAQKAIDDYIADFAKTCPPSMISSNRMQHLYSRLKTIALILVKNTVEEFSKSEFRPAYFELPIKSKEKDAEDNKTPSSLVIKLEKGKSISFSGTIDRVDIYKKTNDDGSVQDVYVRVVDYKTGKKTFSISDVEQGVNLQMLLYLFALCRSSSSEFKKAIGTPEDKSPLPAGVVYLSAPIKSIAAADYNAATTTLSDAQAHYSRTGLLLSDYEVLLAMNSDFDPDYLMGTKRKEIKVSKSKKAKPFEPKADEIVSPDGNYVLSGGSLASAEAFNNLYGELEATITRIGNELIGGKADAIPMENGNGSPCQYCSAKPICRKNRKKGAEDFDDED